MNSGHLAKNSNGDNKPKPNNSHSEEEAVDMLRQKISSIYGREPDAKEEIIESEAAGKHRSEHQQFMHNLSNSGKSLAEIQTAWHEYYVNLSDQDKHQVWQEFYTEHSKLNSYRPDNTSVKTPDKPVVSQAHPGHINRPEEATDERNVADIKRQLVSKVNRRKPSKKAHFHSLLFGLTAGGIAVLFMLFGFFNERFIAPFISPSKSVSSTPIIIDPSSSTIGNEPKIVIPKINVEIPVVYDQPSVEEKDIQKSLEQGVVHYSTTPSPGEKGNGVIFGHSSNNILNKGKYKFAFVLLKQLEVGDTFYLQKDGKRYIYKVGDKKIVKPSDVSILYTQTEQSTMTLVTCDPPGTSLNRLLIIGQQISPDPSKNSESIANKDDGTSKQPSIIPSNAPTLWQRIKDWL